MGGVPVWGRAAFNSTAGEAWRDLKTILPVRVLTTPSQCATQQRLSGEAQLQCHS